MSKSFFFKKEKKRTKRKERIEKELASRELIYKTTTRATKQQKQQNNKSNILWILFHILELFRSIGAGLATSFSKLYFCEEVRSVGAGLATIYNLVSSVDRRSNGASLALMSNFEAKFDWAFAFLYVVYFLESKISSLTFPTRSFAWLFNIPPWVGWNVSLFLSFQ